MENKKDELVRMEIEEQPNLPMNPEYISQIMIARQFPRSVDRCTKNCIAAITLDKAFAQSCIYALPVDGQKVAGPSVHLARLLAQQYGNMRAETQVVDVTATHVVSEAVAFDLETNYAVRVKVWRKITKKDGSRYSESMITTTGNASNAIAFRNAIFYIVAKPVINALIEAAKGVILGEINDENQLIAKRKQVIDGFKVNYGVEESEILKYLGLQSINQIKKEKLLDLFALAQSIVDGDTTVDEAFGRNRQSKNVKIVFGKEEVKS